MIDWKKYSILPTESTLKDYPTAMDILKEIVGKEEEEAMHEMPLSMTNAFLPNFSEKGRYIMERVDTVGLPVLRPLSRSPFTYYRGQSKYHDPCLPSLYRYKGVELEKEIVRSFFQTAEMILVMRTHPVISFLETCDIIDERLGCLPLVVMYDGLAQHYGIKTCYMDLTNDIWTALFFATTTFDGKDYHAKVVKEADEFEEKFGVLYRLDYTPGTEFTDSTKDGIMPIGLQYFNRPGRQFGFVRNMSDVQDLHKVARLERIYFRHDNEVSNLLFSLSQFSKKYMPEDSLVGIVDTICKDDIFCEQTIELVRNIYYRDLTTDEVREKAIAHGLQFTDHLKVGFDKAVIDAEYRDWQNGSAARYKDNIIIFPLYKVEEG